MIIKEGLFFIKMILFVVNFIVLLLGLPTYFLGFEVNAIHNLIFLTIIVCILFISIFIYVLSSKVIKNYYLINEECLVFFKKNVEQFRISFQDVFLAEYLCFSVFTILDQSVFGYLKIKTNKNKEILIDMSHKTARKINKKYFSIIFKK